MFRLYRYVGPAAIAAGAERARGGVALRSPDDIARVARELGLERGSVLTYVVDGLGTLRVADRASEHVECARGGPVLAAGELELDVGARRVAWATNLSTGFCPDVSCFAALSVALARAAIPAPRAFAAAYEMRRCTRCAARQVVKDEVFECAECGAELPARWNLDDARCERGWIAGDVTTWLVDVLVESGGRDEDRARCVLREPCAALVLADGAGGTGRGRLAADRVSNEVERLLDVDPIDLLRELDAELAIAGAETTALVARLAAGERLDVTGAAVGDSRALALRGTAAVDLTADTRRKPLLGSGRASASRFAAREVDTLLLGSDGLFTYADEGAIVSSLCEPTPDCAWQLADRARLPSGRLHDDLSLVLVRRARCEE